jgi:hypothetical protein
MRLSLRKLPIQQKIRVLFGSPAHNILNRPDFHNPNFTKPAPVLSDGWGAGDVSSLSVNQAKIRLKR